MGETSVWASQGLTQVFHHSLQHQHRFYPSSLIPPALDLLSPWGGEGGLSLKGYTFHISHSYLQKPALES